MTAPARVVVAVVSWNTRELLRRCLESLTGDAESGYAEVWVVDNASSDGSPEMVRSDFPWVKLIERADNIGFGPAVNEVARHTDTAWIAPANADVALEPGALRALEKAACPATGVVAPRLIMPNGETQHSVHSFPSLRLGLAFNLGLYRLPGIGGRLLVETFWNPERARQVPWAHGALLLVRREAFDEIGGFDREQWMYAEDIDIQWRLAKAGWHARYEPDAQVLHEVSAATTKAFGDERNARHLAASYAWLARRRGIVTAWAYAALNVTGAGVRWAGLGVAARVRPQRFAQERNRVRRIAGLHARGLRSRAKLVRMANPPASVDVRS